MTRDKRQPKGRRLPVRRETRRLLSQFIQPICLLDARGSLAFANPAAEALLDGPPDDAPGLPENVAAVARRALSEGRALTARELPLRNAAGRPVSADLSVTPLNEPVDGWLLEFTLTDAERESGRALVSQHGAASFLMRSLGHELRNPLAGIRGAAQLLASEMTEKRLTEYTAIIDAECRRLEALLARFGEPPVRRDEGPVNIHEVIEHVAAVLESEEDGMPDLRRDYDPSLPEPPGDRDALVQVMMNLMRNARQAGARHVELATRLERDAVIAGSRHARAIRVSVADDGEGVPASLAPLLFFPMVTGRADGSGLGLALAQAIAIRHDGLITFTSQPGHTVFTLTLPLPGDTHG